MYLNSKEDERMNLIDRTRKQEYFDVEKGGNKSKCEHPIPNFILQQKSMFEKSKFIRTICCCALFCCKTKLNKNNLSTIENKDLEAYYKLRNVAIQTYQEVNPSHEESLKFLFLISLKSELTVDLKNREWKELGFQFFFKTNFFFLEDESEVEMLHKQHKLRKIQISEFKNFIKRQNTNENYHFEILSQTLILIFQEYEKVYDPSKKELNFLSFENIINKSYLSYIYTELNREG